MYMVRQLLFCCILVALMPFPVRAQDANDESEKAIKAAAAKVAPSVVQIITQGGTDLVVTGPKGPAFRKALGPTTGLIVSVDGYIVSSAFNFVNNPTSILVAIPGKPEPQVAKRIATDRARMLTLLKINATGLPVPQMIAKKNIRVGQWAIALGRTLDVKRTGPPSLSIGIISALERVWGRAIQTDAKISPINYGGPLIDIQGRVMGVLVPASPTSDDETAGFEWYDSGIGFAIPMEDIQAVLPRLKQGKDMYKAVLGIQVASRDKFGAVPKITKVSKGSTAEAAGLKSGDVLVEIEGHPVVNLAQVLHILGPLYEGDKLSFKYKRGDKVIAVKDAVLLGGLKEYTHPYLGILPLRDDPDKGVEIRFVFPNSPADKAGLKPGERIAKIGLGSTPPPGKIKPPPPKGKIQVKQPVSNAMQPFPGQKHGREELFDLLNAVLPGTDLTMEVVGKDKKPRTVNVTLDFTPGTAKGPADIIPAKLPETSSRKLALAPFQGGKSKNKPPPKQKSPVGVIKRNLANGTTYVAYVPENYDPNIAHALVVWLHPPGKHKDDDLETFASFWQDYCKQRHMILLMPTSDRESGWVPSDSEFVVGTIREIGNSYTLDSARIVAHGMGVGGQMAIYLGFHARNWIRGVAAVGAVATQVKENDPNQRLAFYLAGGERDPLLKSIAESRDKLAKHHFPAVFREIPRRGRDYLSDTLLDELVRWIDCLDRQ
jgi:serine protease Do